MLLNAIFSFVTWVFEIIAEALPSVQPALYGVSNTLASITSFGVWVIGEDMWLIFLTTVSAWLIFKMTWGIVLFVYRLIPFC